MEIIQYLLPHPVALINHVVRLLTTAIPYSNLKSWDNTAGLIQEQLQNKSVVYSNYGGLLMLLIWNAFKPSAFLANLLALPCRITDFSCVPGAAS